MGLEPGRPALHSPPRPGALAYPEGPETVGPWDPTPRDAGSLFPFAPSWRCEGLILWKATPPLVRQAAPVRAITHKILSVPGVAPSSPKKRSLPSLGSDDPLQSGS